MKARELFSLLFGLAVCSMAGLTFSMATTHMSFIQQFAVGSTSMAAFVYGMHAAIKSLV